MEIKFETQSCNAYRELFHQIKRTQISMESVVPDTQDDIGRLLSVQPALFLKEKTCTDHSVYICGEAVVSIIYINEMENAVSSLQLTQSFTLEYEQGDVPPSLYTQIRLVSTHAEARILNPRKISVTLEVTGELNGFEQGEVQTGTVLADAGGIPVHTKCDSVDAALINAVCEKSFVLNEQFPFSSGKPQPKEMLSHKISFLVTGRQLIGSKILVKGRMCVSVCYIPESEGCPLTEDFSSAFSQLVDIGQEEMDGCAIHIEPTSAWFSLIDSLNGEKALDAEVHALIQIVSRCKKTVSYLSDAYCNLMPVEQKREVLSYDTEAEPARLVLNTEEPIELPEDCSDLILIMPQLSSCALSPGKASAILSLDLLYKTGSGTLSCIRRTVNMEEAAEIENARLIDAQLIEPYFRPDGRQLSLRATVELLIENSRELELPSISGLILNEEEPSDFSAFPTLVAVRIENETLWDLARTYHSSPERISAINDTDGDLRGRLLLIPKSE